MDLEAESAIQVDTAVSLDIAQSCNKLLETQKKMDAIDEQLKMLKATETTLSEQTIPNLMHRAGVSLIKLKDGSAVEIKPFYAARIPLSKVEEAFTWLRENGHGDLINLYVFSDHVRGNYCVTGDCKSFMVQTRKVINIIVL